MKPFAADRSGFALGEGAAFLVLESAAHARRRGATLHATLAGWGSSCDATHLTKPDVEGQARALRAALRQAGLCTARRRLLQCAWHGHAHRRCGRADALAAVWGDALDDLRVSSTKALHGHLLGGAGALEAVITVMALREQQLPPNAHCDEIDPACALNLVRGRWGGRLRSCTPPSAAPSPSAARTRSCCSPAERPWAIPGRHERPVQSKRQRIGQGSPAPPAPRPASSAAKHDSTVFPCA